MVKFKWIKLFKFLFWVVNNVFLTFFASVFLAEDDYRWQKLKMEHSQFLKLLKYKKKFK